MLSLSQAAKHAGISKATVHRAIKSGKLSAVRNADGSYQIDPAELSRVYVIPLGSKDGETLETVLEPVPGRSSETMRNPQRNAPETPAAAVIKAELDGARQMIKMLQDQVEDLRGDRDGWRQQAETAQRLLTHVREAATPAAPARRWWQRLVAG